MHDVSFGHFLEWARGEKSKRSKNTMILSLLVRSFLTHGLPLIIREHCHKSKLTLSLQPYHRKELTRCTCNSTAGRCKGRGGRRKPSGDTRGRTRGASKKHKTLERARLKYRGLWTQPWRDKTPRTALNTLTQRSNTTKHPTTAAGLLPNRNARSHFLPPEQALN